MHSLISKPKYEILVFRAYHSKCDDGFCLVSLNPSKWGDHKEFLSCMENLDLKKVSAFTWHHWKHFYKLPCPGLIISRTIACRDNSLIREKKPFYVPKIEINFGLSRNILLKIKWDFCHVLPCLNLELRINWPFLLVKIWCWAIKP